MPLAEDLGPGKSSNGTIAATVVGLNPLCPTFCPQLFPAFSGFLGGRASRGAQACTDPAIGRSSNPRLARCSGLSASQGCWMLESYAHRTRERRDTFRPACSPSWGIGCTHLLSSPPLMLMLFKGEPNMWLDWPGPIRSTSRRDRLHLISIHIDCAGSATAWGSACSSREPRPSICYSQWKASIGMPLIRFCSIRATAASPR